MKKIQSSLIVLFFATLFLPMCASAQENQAVEWIRVQSDNGEFSIEVPAKYTFVVDKTGFSVADSATVWNQQQDLTTNAAEISSTNMRMNK